MPLNDLAIKRAIKRAKPGPKIIKLSDGGGLQLWITPDGAKRWRMAYRFAGAQKLLAIAIYNTIGLKEARQAREQARRALANGQDPSRANERRKLPKSSRIPTRSTPSRRN